MVKNVEEEEEEQQQQQKFTYNPFLVMFALANLPKLENNVLIKTHSRF